jgi:TorA maturation chaperone TorD
VSIRTRYLARRVATIHSDQLTATVVASGMVNTLQQEDLRVRANVYRLLGGLFLTEPTGDVLDVLRVDETWAIFGILAPSANLPLLRSRLTSDELDLEAVRLEYHRLFSVPAGPYVFPYESCYSVPEPPGPLMGPATIAVVNAYAEAGFALSPEFQDAPDHLGVEFRFVAELLDREAQALEDGDASEAERFASLRSRFCGEHLSQWVAKVADRIAASGVSDFYAGLSSLATEIVAGE